MDDTLLVGCVDRSRQGFHQSGRLLHRHWDAAQVVRQAAPFYQLQREKWMAPLLADFINLHNVGMLQTGDGLGFLAEAGDFFRIGMLSGQNDFERYQALETDLPSFVNAAHAAPAEHAQDFVAADYGPIRINGSIRSGRAFDAWLSR